MTRGKALGLALVLQLLAILLLTQTWFEVLMAPNGKLVTLGSFDGATTYPAAMPLQLFALAATVFALLTRGAVRAVVLGLAALAPVASVVTIGLAAMNKQISALDSQLDRLTGIANTHGISGLTVNASTFTVLWLACEVVTALWLAASAWMSGNWKQNEAAQRTERAKSAKPGKSAKSTIDLWDDQRG